MAGRPTWLSASIISQHCPLKLRLHVPPGLLQPAHKTARSASSLRRKFTPVNVSDNEIAQLASQPLHPHTLFDFVRQGPPPLSPSRLLSSARFTSSLLPTRLAHRLHSLRNLPFIVVSNPSISLIYQNYLHSLSTLLPFYRHGIDTLEEEALFSDALADLVQTHANTIPTLAKGLKECGRYLGMSVGLAGDAKGEGGSMGPGTEAASVGARFLDEHLRARIGTRLVAEQHLALHLASVGPGTSGGWESSSRNLHGTDTTHPHSEATAPQSSFIGVIDTALRPVSVLRHAESFVGELCELKYGVRPSVLVDGDVDACITHVPTHLEYVLTELLKNAFRATVERGTERDAVQVTVALSEEYRGIDTNKTNEATPTLVDSDGDGEEAIIARKSGTNDPHSRSKEKTLTLRIRDRGGGISPDVLPHIWDYSFTTFDDSVMNGGGLATLAAAGAENSSIAGLGYGLPLGRAYAEHFGGDLRIQSLWGWGTDVYLRLKGLQMD